MEVGNQTNEQQQRESSKFESAEEHPDFSLLTEQICENLSKENEGKMDQETFRAGTIHNKEFRNFWMTDLKSDEWVQQTIEIGYVLPLVNLPPCYE